MRSPKVAHNPSVTLVNLGLSRSANGTAPTRRSATPGAKSHTATLITTHTTTNTTAPMTSDTANPTTRPTTNPGTNPVSAHRDTARRRLAAISSGNTSVAPRPGSMTSGANTSGATATGARDEPLRFRFCDPPPDRGWPRPPPLLPPLRLAPLLRLPPPPPPPPPPLPPLPPLRFRFRLRFRLRLRLEPPLLLPPLPPLPPPPPPPLPPASLPVLRLGGGCEFRG